MRKIGILGGMSTHATAEYCRMLNEEINAVRGEQNKAPLLQSNLSYAYIEAFVRREQWNGVRDYLVSKAQELENGGADFIVLASNTMHRVAPQIEAAIKIPFIHIIDVAAEEIKRQNIKKVGVLGTKSIMLATFYRNRFKQHGIEVIAPTSQQCEIINTIIFNELVFDIIKNESRKIYVNVIQELVDQGVQGIVSTLTDIELLVKSEDIPELSLFNTKVLHCKKVAKLAMRN